VPIRCLFGESRLNRNDVPMEAKTKTRLCRTCGETDQGRFYPYLRFRCRRCTILLSGRNPGRRYDTAWGTFLLSGQAAEEGTAPVPWWRKPSSWSKSTKAGDLMLTLWGVVPRPFCDKTPAIKLEKFRRGDQFRTVWGCFGGGRSGRKTGRPSMEDLFRIKTIWGTFPVGRNSIRRSLTCLRDNGPPIRHRWKHSTVSDDADEECRSPEIDDDYFFGEV
jgi:hypothetical protein